MKIKFNNKHQPGFFKDVRKEVDNYFQENNLSKNANGEMVAKTIFFMMSLVTLYFLILSNNFGLLASLGLVILVGMVKAFIGFNISHDAIHGSYSSNKNINKLLSYSFPLIGANAYVWEITHNKVHHTYTNIAGHDEDLEVAPGLIRLSPQDKYSYIMKFQHLYAFLLYCLSSLSWVFRKDYKKFFQKKIGNIDNTGHPKKEYFKLFFFKFLYYAIYIIIPLIVLDITWWQFLIGFLVMHMSEGLVLGLVFQLAHVVEDTQYPVPDVEGNMQESWAIHQMYTTANFACKSPLAKFLCGGLNFQIEHHLFPHVCHVHYPVISKIVKAKAREYSIPYYENETFFKAIKSHYQTLKQFGNPEPALVKVTQ